MDHHSEHRDAPPAADRVLGIGEDPLAWTFPLARVGWLRLRVHVFVPLWVGAELIAWLPHDRLGFIHVAALTASLLALALIREVARSLVGRLAGAEVQPVCLWPLGGLVPMGRGEGRRPVLAECGGLAAGLLLVPVLGWLVIASGAGRDALLFNPFRPGATAGGLRSLAQVAAWWAYYANAVMLALNILLPMSPMDAGRLLRAWAEGRGRARVTDTPLRVGLLVALGLFIFAATAGEPRMMALAAFGALATFFDRRRVEFRALEAAEPSPDLDGVLAKISREGLGALSEAEREALSAETARRRAQRAP